MQLYSIIGSAKIKRIFEQSKFFGKKLQKKYFHKPCESVKLSIFGLAFHNNLLKFGSFARNNYLCTEIYII